MWFSSRAKGPNVQNFEIVGNYVKCDDNLKTFVLNEISLVIHNDSLIES